MKRTLLILLSAILLCTALPFAPVAAETEQTFDADHVLIYNPLPYVKNANDLFSGTLPKAAPEPEPSGDALFTPGMHRTGKDLSTKTDGEDTHAFWVCTDLNTYTYDKRTFRLAAEGAHCRIWTLDGDDAAFTEEQTQKMLSEFESVIYPNNTAAFGAFRDLGGDGKLHIVTYAMNSLAVCGFFDAYDLYTKEEIAVIDPDDPDSYNYLPIINVNARMAEDETTVLCTLAHEFQHLILRSAVLASPANAGRLGRETTVGLWLNEGFSMAAEELNYPGAVEEQGYLASYARSDKVRLGMSYANFDTTSKDIGAYGQSFLFAQYFRTQCGDRAFADLLRMWREAQEQEALTEAHMLDALLTDGQKAALDAVADYTGGALQKLGSEENVRLSKFALAFRLALLQNGEGIWSTCACADMPVYAGSGRKIEGGGALLLETNGSFAVPNDAQSGLVFVWLKDGAITGTYTVPEPEEGFYVIAVERNGEWTAIAAAPCEDGILKGVAVGNPENGTIAAKDADGAIFCVTRQGDGYRFACDDANGSYALMRTDTNKQALAVRESDAVFAWQRFADGADRLQADGQYGRAILYGSIAGGFGYFPPAYFENESFDKVHMLRVTWKNGDANMDGQLTAADAALILRTLVKLSYMNAPMRAAADCDGDGEVTAADASKVLRTVVQLESEEDGN
jgi:hypothetical protein